MQVYESECPCWHEIYNREISKSRRVTDYNCSHCEGSGIANFVRFYNPRNVVCND
jgi:predicted SprT family Zn-dependent metalloprotease